MKPDLHEASRFIRALSGNSLDAMTFQVFDDTKRKREECAQIFHGTLAHCWSDLAHANETGCGIFVAVNECDGNGRKTHNVCRVRALHIDTDGFIPAEWHLEPSIVNKSKAGVHAYWLVSDCSLADFKSAQQRLIAHYGSDKHVCDLPRVLRLPGYWHVKAEPYMVEMLQTWPDKYTLADVLWGLPQPEADWTPPTVPRGLTDDARVRGAVAWIAQRSPAIEGQGGRMHTLATTTRLANMGIAFDDAWQLLCGWNCENQGPWPERDLHGLLQSAWRKAHR